jgi:hypothetical protein
MAPSAESLFSGSFLRFEEIVEVVQEHLHNLDFLSFFSDYCVPNTNHFALSNLASLGVMLITTNFDCLVEEAAREKGKELDQIVTHEEFSQAKFTERSLFKLHGTAARWDGHDFVKSLETLRTTISGQLQLNPDIATASIVQEFLKQALCKRNLMVLGYSGLDDFDIMPILQLTTSDKQLLWVEHTQSPAELYSFDEVRLRPISKHRMLLESLCAVGARRPDSIWLYRGNTQLLLGEYAPGGHSVAPTNNANYEGHISQWAHQHLRPVDRLLFTLTLLGNVERWDEALVLFEKHSTEIYSLAASESRCRDLVFASVARNAARLSDKKHFPVAEWITKVRSFLTIANEQSARAAILNSLAVLLLRQGERNDARDVLNLADEACHKSGAYK